MYNIYMNTLNWKGKSLLIGIIIVIVTAVYLIHNYNQNKQLAKLGDENTEIGKSNSEEKGNINNNAYVSKSTNTEIALIKAKWPTPSFDVNGLMNLYANEAYDKYLNDWRDGGDVWKEEIDLRKQFPDRPTSTSHELDIDYEYKPATVTVNDSNYTYHNYIIHTYTYTGGAHGDTDIKTFTFATSSNTYNGIITLEQATIGKLGAKLDLSNNNAITMSKIMLAKLPKILTAGDSSGDNSMYNEEMAKDGLGLSYLKKDGTLDKKKCNCDSFDFKNNLQFFYITNDGITFIMGQYQVAPYAAGMPEIPFTWEELSEFISK